MACRTLDFCGVRRPPGRGGTHGGRALADPFDWFFCFVFETVAKTDFENNFSFFCFSVSVLLLLRPQLNQNIPRLSLYLYDKDR